MKNNWNEEIASAYKDDPLRMRVYTSQLLGKEEDLVLHGGGNTSVKIKETNIFGEKEDILYVKGSGWDLATIKEAGFAPVKLKTLLQMAELEDLTDTDMVKYQRAAMTNPSAPNPSVEAILHAIIPFDFVDHTHADAVVTISNTPNGEEQINELYGDTVLIVPYVMPGFILAREIFKMTQNIDWNQIQGMILLNHGVFTFHNDAKASYEKMIEIVSKAELYLEQNISTKVEGTQKGQVDPHDIASIRKNVADVWGKPILAQINNSKFNTAFSNLSNVEEITNRGPLTPDHIIRTKRTPVILSGDPKEDIESYASNYQQYFDEFSTGDLVCLDKAPRWAIAPARGTISFGPNLKSNRIIHDITRHTMNAIYQAEQLGGWKALSRKDLFDMEYWVLEQEKLKKGKKTKPMQGKIALVSGAASGIGKACTERLVLEGAVVAALDIDQAILNCFDQKEVLSIQCDVTDESQLKEAIEKTVVQFGGLDLLVTNAGTFPSDFTIENMDKAVWNASLEVNLSSHMQLMKLASPYLALGIDPAVVIVGSKNVIAPGPGAAAYSVAKAGLTQLGRIAAMEMGKQGVRVNTIHPNAVFDTGIWTEEVLQARAAHYNMTVDEYKARNILKAEITSNDVAELVVCLLGKTFWKITGAQIPVDGGTDRTI
ncbi:MAG: bifunctional aldolase/short-chain dehydrogenase [Bacteroidota bacterium]